MTTDDLEQEIDRQPFVPLRLHLASGQKVAIEYPNSSFVRDNTLLIVHRVRPRTSRIGGYDVIALSLIERIEQDDSPGGPKRTTRRKA